MSVGRELDVIVQNLRRMQDGEAVESFPREVTVWDRLFESPLIDCLPVGVLLLDNDFTICRFNSTYSTYFGRAPSCSPATAIGTTYFNCFPEASTTIVDHFLHVKTSKQQLDAYRQPYTDWECREQTYWDAHLVPLTQRSAPAGMMLVTTDVTEQVGLLNLIRSKDAEVAELKTTLVSILKLREQINYELEEKMVVNTKYLVEPLVDKLKHHLGNSEYLPYVEGIESTINNIGSDFGLMLGIKGYGLTPKEMQIAVMINIGRTTKEIAKCLHVSTESIDFHRKNIRIKLGCKQKNINLKTALSALLSKTDLPIP
jgi:DNA-binding CsgD family transcriptional regulator